MIGLAGRDGEKATDLHHKHRRVLFKLPLIVTRPLIGGRNKPANL
jgi:hypothetical protein